MKKLGYPTIFCNELIVAEDGEITGFKMRCEQSKLTTVKALQSIGYDTIASGDSHNDLGMILANRLKASPTSTELIMDSRRAVRRMCGFWSAFSNSCIQS